MKKHTYINIINKKRIRSLLLYAAMAAVCASSFCCAEETESFWEEGDVLLIDEEEEDLVDEQENLMSAEEVAQAVRLAENEAIQARIDEQMAAMEESRQLIDNGFEPEQADAQMLQEYMNELTAIESPTGSDGELLLGRYIESVLEEEGYAIEEQAFHEGFLNEDLVDIPGVNIIAERGIKLYEDLPAPEGNRNILILCAHYDSVSKPEENDWSANDKSGPAVLMEAARILSHMDVGMDLCFLFLSGEEDGSYGSENFMKKLGTAYADRIMGVIYVDQIGLHEEAPYYIQTADGDSNTAGMNILSANRIQNILDEETSMLDVNFVQANPRDLEWGIEKAEEPALGYFAAAGIDAARLYQKLQDTADGEGSAGKDDKKADSETQSYSAGSSDDAEQIIYEPDLFGSSVKNDMAIAKRLARVTDIVVRTVGFYMGMSS